MKITKNVSKKVIVLGIDALDPSLITDLMAQGKLPNFQKLQAAGSFSRLSTTMPPLSPVVWASFITGLNPAGHGIFDFVELGKNYELNSSLIKVAESKNIEIFGRSFQIYNPKIIKVMKGKPLWEYTKNYSIPTYTFFLPHTFPPDRINGKMLSGMGTPDFYNTEGVFAFYTQNRSFKNKIDENIGQVLCFDDSVSEINTVIYGPKDISNLKRTSIALGIKIEEEKVILKMQGRSFEVRKGEWGEWISIKFNLSNFLRVHGICKFYLEQTRPLHLYLSPINFDPRRPPFPISYPKNYAKKLAGKAGLYHTLGMPGDINAWDAGILSDAAFLREADCILRERKQILLEELAKFKRGIFTFYLGTLDYIQHAFWNSADPNYSLHGKSQDKNIVQGYYCGLDRILGRVLDYVDNQTTLIIFSDHGFTYFRKNVNLNSWLKDNGYLTFKNTELAPGRMFFRNIDWLKTKAYNLGFNGVCINLKGREPQGMVLEEEAEKLKIEIIHKLENIIDPDTAKNIINKVYLKEKLYQGRYFDKAPDLIIGYNAGYHASRSAILGGASDEVLENSEEKWKGTHFVDAGLVPGALFTNRKINKNNPDMLDILPTILKLFNIPKSKEMTGESLF